MMASVSRPLRMALTTSSWPGRKVSRPNTFRIVRCRSFFDTLITVDQASDVPCAMANDIAFEMAVSSIRFGTGVTREVGMDLAEMSATRVLVMTDPVLRSLRPVHTVLESLDAARLRYSIF